MAIKQGDFIEVVYTGRIKENNKVFDTTDINVAKEQGVKVQVKPAIICVGKGDMLGAIDESFVGKEAGAEYVLEVEQGFGKRDPALIQLLSANEFKAHDLTPYPGLEINVDGRFGVVKTVGSGRILVDFNHPLAGKDLVYNIKIVRVVTDTKEKADGFLRLKLGRDFSTIYADNKYIVKLKLPEEIKQELERELKERIPEIKEIVFEEEKKG